MTGNVCHFLPLLCHMCGQATVWAMLIQSTSLQEVANNSCQTENDCTELAYTLFKMLSQTKFNWYHFHFRNTVLTKDKDVLISYYTAFTYMLL
jgi:hypothetical protein